MQDISLEDNRRLLRLRPETEEDLWALATAIRPGDLVFARTSRELKEGGGSRRRPMSLGVLVEHVDHQPFTRRLRVHGVITSSPKEFDLVGQHHTLSVEPGMEVAILREERWLDEDLERIKGLSRAAAPKVLVAAVDDEEFALALVKGYGVQMLDEGDISLPGKDRPEDRERRFEEEMGRVAAEIRRAAQESEARYVVVAGPAHWKDEVAKRMGKEVEGMGMKLFVENVSTGGIKGIYEALRREAVKRALSDAILMDELSLMEGMNSLISRRPGLVAYTLEGVEGAVKEGAVKEVVVDSELLRSPDEVTRARVLELLEMAKEMGAKVTVLESRHMELRAWIKGFGGILAVLRYEKNK